MGTAGQGVFSYKAGKPRPHSQKSNTGFNDIMAAYFAVLTR
jgi:hypothetical protein